MAVPKLRFKAADGSQFPDWEEKTIDEVAECLDNKRVPVNAEERKKRVGVIPYYGAGGIQGYIDDYLFDEELVLLLEDGDAFDDFQTKSIAQYVTGKSWVNNHAHVLRANGNSYFLFASLEHKDIRKWTQLAGASRKKLLKDSMLKITVNMPSLPEQQKIAELLSTIDTVIEKQKETVSAWEERKKGVMQKLFSQEVRFKAADGSDFPEWEKKKLGDCCSIKTGKLDASAAKENGKYKFFTCAREDSSIDTYSFEGVAILIAGNGDVGHTKIYDGRFDAYQRTYVLQHFTENPYYLKTVIDMNLPRRIASELQKGAMPYIKLGTLSDLIVPYPINKDEQQKIADCLVSFDEVIEKQKATLAAWEELKKGLLQKMFCIRTTE